MSLGKPYLHGRIIFEKPEDYVVIVPENAERSIPFSCEICHVVFRSQYDEAAYFKFGCCARCARLWAESRKESWAAGWRPTPDQVKSVEDDRLPLSITFNVD